MFGRIVVGVMLGLLGLLLIPVGLVSQIVMLRFHLRPFLLGFGEALSQLVNVSASIILNATCRAGGIKFGHPDMSTSATLGSLQATQSLTPVGEVVVSLLDYVDPNHCRKAYEKWLHGCQ